MNSIWIRWGRLGLAFALLCALAACAPHDHDDHGHDHGADDDHGHDHGADDDHGHDHGADDEHEDDDHGHDHGADDDDGHDDHGHDHGADDDHGHDDDGHDDHGADDDHGHDDHGDPDEVTFSRTQQDHTAFSTMAAEVRAMRPSILSFARLVLPDDASAIVTAPTAGRVQAAGDGFVVVGERVTSGDVLAAIVAVADATADPAALDLDVQRASIAVDAAQREVDRVAPLVAQGIVAQRRLDEAERALADAQAALSAAQRRRRTFGQSQRVDGDADRIDVPAPIDGLVVERIATPGSWVEAGDPIVRIVNRESLWLDVAVPEALLPRMRRVHGAWFEFDGDDTVYTVPPSALVSIGAEVDPHTRTLPVRFVVDNRDRSLFVGQSARAHLVADTPREVVTVHRGAVVDDDGDSVVFVQIGAETFRRQLVRTGVRDGDFVEIVDGVEPGDRVVVDGAWSVRLASLGGGAIGHGHSH